MAFYITPIFQLGYAAVYFSGPFGLGGWAHRLDLQLAVQASIVIRRRWHLFARPLSFDLQIDDDGVAVRYDLLVGAGLSF